MILYHGSYIAVDNPDLLHSRTKTDFGRGFYLTSLYNQAKNWCQKFRKRGRYGNVSRYILNDAAFEKLKLLRFAAYSEDWLDFVMACRKGTDSTDYDAVSGGVADDRVFNTVELYFENLIDKSEAIKRLCYEKPHMQITLRSAAALSCIRFAGSEKL